ncbi:MAG: hypothetical protein AAGA77_11925 [Bacteroidota bacterium]
MTLIDPNTSIEEISNEVLKSEFLNPVRYKKRNLYALMARRAIEDIEIKSLLFELILSIDARNENEMGFIKHSWLPAIFLLQEANTEIKLELKAVLKQWTADEKEIFLNYIKSEQEYYYLLCDIIDRNDYKNTEEE